MIESHVDVRLYFRERLQEALRTRAVETQERTEFYLVNLLSSFAVSPDEEVLSLPLVKLLSEAMEAETQLERIRRFRDLGDSALYILGFFADHLEHRRISRDYVVTMGGQAYLNAGQLVQRGDGMLSEVYEELARKFDTLARAIYDVREATTLRTPQDIVKLYERWRTTRSPELAKRLKEEGLFPVDLIGKDSLH